MNVKAFISIANRSLQNTLAYRTSYILTFASNFIGFIATYALWHAIFDGREQLAGLSWEQMKAYLLITFITNALLSWYSETRIANKILDGSVAADLLKPLDFQQARFAETLGSGLVEGGLAAILITVVMIITSGVMVPHTLVTWVLFLCELNGFTCGQIWYRLYRRTTLLLVNRITRNHLGENRSYKPVFWRACSACLFPALVGKNCDGLAFQKHRLYTDRYLHGAAKPDACTRYGRYAVGVGNRTVAAR